MVLIFCLLVVIFLLMLVISRIKAVANQGAVARDAIVAKDRSKNLLQFAAIHIYMIWRYLDTDLLYIET